MSRLYKWLFLLCCAGFSGLPGLAQSGTCPAGQPSILETGFAIAAGLNNQGNSFLAGEAPFEITTPIAQAVGPSDPDNTPTTEVSTTTFQTFDATIDLDLTGDRSILIPENSDIIVSVAEFPFGSAQLEIYTSASDAAGSFDFIGTIGLGGSTGTLATVPNASGGDSFIGHVTFQAPAGGANIVRIENVNNSGFRIDGVQRNEICQSGPPQVDAANDSGSGVAGDTGILTVVDNDTLGGSPLPAPNAAGSTTTLSLSAASSLPPELTFDTSTGDVGISSTATPGMLTFDYQICETNAEINCDTAQVTITVPDPGSGGGGGALICPAGQTAIQLPTPLPAFEGFETDGNDSTPPAIGSGVTNNLLSQPILAAGTGVTGFPGPDAVASFGDSIDFDLTGDDMILVPGGAIITLAVAEFPGEPQFPTTTVLASPTANLVDATVLGTLGFGGTIGTLTTTDGASTVQSDPGTPSDTALIRHVDITAPAGGARFIRIDLTGFSSPNGFQVRGAQYQNQCQPAAPAGPQLNGAKTVELVDPAGFSLPGTDVIYTLTVTSIGTSDIDEDSIFLIDRLPEDVGFLNRPFTPISGVPLSPDPVVLEATNASAITFDYATDVRFSVQSTPPTSFTDCNLPAAIPLVLGANPVVNFVCLNPKGTLAAPTASAPNPTLALRFQVRIQ